MGLAMNDNIFLYSATRLQDVLAEILSMRPRAVIVDSIQTVYLDDVNGSAGSVSQVRSCCLLPFTLPFAVSCPASYHLLPFVMHFTLLFLPVFWPIMRTVYLDDVNGSAGSFSQVRQGDTACCFAHYPAHCCLLFCPSPCRLVRFVLLITLLIVFCPSPCRLVPVVLPIILLIAAYYSVSHAACLGTLFFCDCSSATATTGIHPQGYSELFVAEPRKRYVLDLH